MSDKRQEIIFEGVVLYANIPPRPAQKALETEDTSYSIMVECTKERFKQLKAAGMPSLTQLKEFPDDFISKKTGTAPVCEQANGKSFIRIRATKSRVTKKGDVMDFQDIPVIDEYGDPITNSVANGSIAKVLAVLEPASKGSTHMALRLKVVVITNLIIWEDDKSGLPSSLGLKKKEKIKIEDVAPFSDDETDSLFKS